MRKARKFSEGGRASAMRDRRMADIEKDYKKALARGMSEREAQAKREQRIADAQDDYAKRTGADRTQTRAAERAAEQKLTATRRGADTGTQPVSVLKDGAKPLTSAKLDAPDVTIPDVAPKKPSGSTPRKPAPRRAAAPKPKPKPDVSLQVAIRRPAATAKPDSKPKPESVGKRIMRTSARRQNDQLSQLGREIGSFFSPLLKNKYSDRAKGYAKGGKIDGCAVRGMTKATRKK